MNTLREYIKIVGGVENFAALTGYSQSMIYHILKGRRNISLPFARKCQQVTRGRLSAAELLFGKR